ncbi:3-ketoacyl-ACP reductase [Thioclava sp. SK-1]|uniref:SDR family oxidoreductase n=1 Tax=Thioclava sp. SK-1 TaxID=1889770 RepID=UPI000824DC70|nr:SDR family oxidoreductase [Thioclava sp. SK-1]OCX66499.1 3-ketoacyl-ACP reductase [Thioclava sp. SK-1]
MSSAQKTALVTGGSRGIGAAISTRLAADGFSVVVNYAGNAQAAQSLVDTITQNGGQAIAVQADVADPVQVAALFEQAQTAFGVPNVVVNSAGVLKMQPVAEVDDATFDQMVAVNFKGTFNTLREAARQMPDGGRIINLSTSVVGAKLERYAIYTATKAAVESMSAILAKELRGRNITVNSVAPGPTGTDLFYEGKSDEFVAQLAKMNPLERIATPEDIAGVVSFLAGPDGGWINAQTLRANGGMV